MDFPVIPGEEFLILNVHSFTAGKMLVEIALVISQAGFCCSYLIYISETLSSLTPFTRIQILLLAMPLLMGMALIKVSTLLHGAA